MVKKQRLSCDLCESKSYVFPRMIVPEDKGGDNAPNNMINLCRNCVAAVLGQQRPKDSDLGYFWDLYHYGERKLVNKVPQYNKKSDLNKKIDVEDQKDPKDDKSEEEPENKLDAFFQKHIYSAF